MTDKPFKLIPVDQLDCSRCTCPRLDALEEQVAQMWPFFESFYRAEARAVQHQRLMAARGGGSLISRRDIQRMTGCGATAVKDWTTEPTFPAVIRPGRGGRPDLYNKAAVNEWLDEHFRKPKVKAAIALRDAKKKGQDG